MNNFPHALITNFSLFVCGNILRERLEINRQAGSQAHKQPDITEGGGFVRFISCTKAACLVNRYIVFAISKAAELNLLVQGGQLYLSGPFSKGSLDRHTERGLETSGGHRSHITRPTRIPKIYPF